MCNIQTIFYFFLNKITSWEKLGGFPALFTHALNDQGKTIGKLSEKSETSKQENAFNLTNIPGNTYGAKDMFSAGIILVLGA